MRMNQDEIRFDFHGLGLAIKQAREERGWTQAYVVELVGKTDRTIMNIENKEQSDATASGHVGPRLGFGASPNKPPLCHLWPQRHCLPFSDTSKIAQKTEALISEPPFLWLS